MFTRAQRARTAIAVACCVAFSSPARAQTRSSWQLFGGYAPIHDAQEDLTLPLGWAASVARAVNSWLSIVADAGGNYKTIALVGSDAKVASHSLVGGTRASAKIGQLIEFGQILIGAVHASGTSFGQSSAATNFALQGGAGVDLPFDRRFAGRIELDVRFLNTGRQSRFLGGVVYTLR
jgi:hypothetical protein